MRPPLAIREEDIAAYHRDGGALLRGVLDAEAMDLLEQGVEQVRRNRGAQSSLVRDEAGMGETLVEQYPSRRAEGLHQLIARGIVGEIAGRVMRTPSAQLVLDQLFYKTPGRIVPTPWHQDTPFLRVRGYDLVRVWICADPSPGELTLEIVRGSHLWNVTYNSRTVARSKLTSELDAHYSNDDIGDEYLPLVPDIGAHRDSFDLMRWDVEPGDVLVVHGNILHGAGGCAHHPLPRRAFASLWGGPKLRHHRPTGKAFPPPGPMPEGGDIPQGAPIGDFPESFPIGWQSVAG